MQAILYLAVPLKFKEKFPLTFNEITKNGAFGIENQTYSTIKASTFPNYFRFLICRITNCNNVPQSVVYANISLVFLIYLNGGAVNK